MVEEEDQQHENVIPQLLRLRIEAIALAQRSNDWKVEQVNPCLLDASLSYAREVKCWFVLLARLYHDQLVWPDLVDQGDVALRQHNYALLREFGIYAMRSFQADCIVWHPAQRQWYVFPCQRLPSERWQASDEVGRFLPQFPKELPM